MEIDPAPGDAVDPDDHVAGAPVRFLDARFEKDDPPQLADDIALLLQMIDNRGRQIDGMPAFLDFGEKRPVLLLDLDHVVEAGVVAVGHFGEAEVGALAGMGRDDVVDDDGVVGRRHAAHRHELFLRAEAGSMSKLMRSKLPSTVGV
jgi:hypothetical protein